MMVREPAGKPADVLLFCRIHSVRKGEGVGDLLEAKDPEVHPRHAEWSTIRRSVVAYVAQATSSWAMIRVHGL